MDNLDPAFDWRRFRRDGALADLGDVTLWYDEEGRGGEPLVLLGGFGAGHHIWDFVWPLLDGFHRITLEPRGLGRSRPAAAPVRRRRVGRRPAARCSITSEIERTHVWATGFGNYYAVRFIARNPERVNRFVGYTDVWAGDPSKGYDKIWKVYGTAIETFGTTGFGARLLTGMFSVPWLPWFPDWEAENLAATMHPDTAAATAGYCLTEADVRDDLDAIRVPDPRAPGRLRLGRQAPRARRRTTRSRRCRSGSPDCAPRSSPSRIPAT